MRKRLVSQKVIAVLLCAALMFALAGCEKVSTQVDIDPALDSVIRDAIRNGGSDAPEGVYANEAYDAYGIAENGDRITLYVWALYGRWDCAEGDVRQVSVSFCPAVIALEREKDGGYRLTEYLVPAADGEDDGAWIPAELREAYEEARSDSYLLYDEAKKDASQHFIDTDAVKRTLRGTVTGVEGGLALVAPDEGAPEKESYAVVGVPLARLDTRYSTLAGDTLEVVYTGGLTEADPPVPGRILSVSLTPDEKEPVPEKGLTVCIGGVLYRCTGETCDTVDEESARYEEVYAGNGITITAFAQIKKGKTVACRVAEKWYRFDRV